MVQSRFSSEFKDQVVKEVMEVGVVATVAAKHGVSSKTIHNWLRSRKNGDQINQLSQVRDLQKKLKDADLEIRVLKALLKKTYPHWESAEQL